MQNHPCFPGSIAGEQLGPLGSPEDQSTWKEGELRRAPGSDFLRGERAGRRHGHGKHSSHLFRALVQASLSDPVGPSLVSQLGVENCLSSCFFFVFSSQDHMGSACCLSGHGSPDSGVPTRFPLSRESTHPPGL